VNRIISTTALALTFAVIGTGAASAANAATPHTTVVKPLINKWDGARLVQPSLRKMNSAPTVVQPAINKWDSARLTPTTRAWIVSPLINKWDVVVASSPTVKWGSTPLVQPNLRKMNVVKPLINKWD